MRGWDAKKSLTVGDKENEYKINNIDTNKERISDSETK